MFYGNAANTTNIAFQFDKIYETRYAMEQAIYGNDALGIKRDYIAPGRYVLVSYGYDKKINNSNGTVTTDDDFVRVYSNAINQDTVGKTNSIGNINGVFFSEETGTFYSSPDCTPESIIKLANFTVVPNPVASDINLYYFKKNGFYYKAHHFYADEIYYISDVSDTGQFVAIGQIVRRVANNIAANTQYVVSYDYTKTTDTEIDESKEYYTLNAFSNNYELVTTPLQEDIDKYYERHNPTMVYTTNSRRLGYTEQFYICTGYASDDTSLYKDGYDKCVRLNYNGTNPLYKAAAFKPIALFTSVDDPYSQDYMEQYKTYTTPYLEHYNVDYAHFYTLDKTWGTLHRGYDATVWQKVIGEGIERYILIAHLNSLFPGIEIVQEPPTHEPLSPFIGAESTDMIARLHMQNPWGFEVKSYDTSGKTSEEIESMNILSDENVVVKRYTYEPKFEENEEGQQIQVGYETDEDGNLIHQYDQNHKYKIEEKEEPAYIYYNKAGLDKLIHADTSEADNHIKITPTGKSLGFDAKYRTSQLMNKTNITGDIQELDISLPAIGNMVTEGYDLIYGDGQENSEHKRHLDTKWYNASETEFIKYGDSSTYSGGKTFDLNTLAGSLNSYHNRLGQIIEPLTEETYPQTNADFEALNSNYIYQYDDEYYKIGQVYSEKGIDYEYYQCGFRLTEDTVLDPIKDYYEVLNGEFVKIENPNIEFLSNYFEQYNEVTADSWMEGTYYIATTSTDKDRNRVQAEIEYLNTRKYLKPDYAASFNPDTTYYKRVLANSSWYQETQITPWAPDSYFYKSGQAYILETGNSSQPGEAIHYHIKELNHKAFIDAYRPNYFYVYEPITGNYVKAMEEEMLPNQQYYTINQYGNVDWEIANTTNIGTSFLPYLANFYYFIVDINGEGYRILDTNTVPGEPEYYVKTKDSVVNPSTRYYTYNTISGTYEYVTVPIDDNISNYYVKLRPTVYYYYELGDEPTIGMTESGQWVVTYPVISQREIATSSFGVDRVINGKEYKRGITPTYYQDEDGNFIKVTLDFLKSQPADFFDLDFNVGKYGGCWYIEPVDRTNDIFTPNVYWDVDDPDHPTYYRLATQEVFEENRSKDYYSIKAYKVVSESINPFYSPGQFYYRDTDDENEPLLLNNDASPTFDIVPASTVQSYNYEHSFNDDINKVGEVIYYINQGGDAYYPDWLSPSVDITQTYYKVHGHYYKKAAIAIQTDITGETPAFYRWSESYTLVPWKFNLCTLDAERALIKLVGFDNGASSLNGQLLSLHNLLSLEDEYTRDPDTVQGALNLVSDKFYTLGEFIPGRIMFVNSYGRLTSSQLTHQRVLEVVREPRNYLWETDNNTIITSISQNDGWLTIEDNNIGNMKLAGYELAAAGAEVSATDTINTAFGKLQKSLLEEVENRTNAIAALDMTTDTSTTDQVIDTISETDGIVTANHVNIGTRTLGGYSGAAGILASDTINGAFDKVQAALNLLNANASTTGSVDQKVTTAITNLIDGAPDSLDTLKELADWIGDDSSGATQTLANINTHLTNIDTKLTLGTHEVNGEQVQYNTVKDYVENYVSSSVSTGIAGVHVFANQTLLDSYDQTNADLTDAVNKRHEHNNKTELDLIQSGDVQKWNNKQDAIPENTYDVYGAATTAESNAKTYADGLASNYEVAGAASQAETNAKNYADGLANNYDASGAAQNVLTTITGTNDDTSSDLTLNGLLKYIQELENRIATLESTPEPEPEP